MKGIKNSNSNISWTNIKNIIKYLPMFFNQIKKVKLSIREDELLNRKVYLKGNYFLFRSLHKNIFPILSMKNINGGRTIIETFFVDNDLTLIGALKKERILSIRIISPLDNTTPLITKEDTNKVFN